MASEQSFSEHTSDSGAILAQFAREHGRDLLWSAAMTMGRLHELNCIKANSRSEHPEVEHRHALAVCCPSALCSLAPMEQKQILSIDNGVFFLSSSSFFPPPQLVFGPFWPPRQKP